ncbi:hypothetical protein CFC21_038562 [Triticum aestivum]|uniref:Uncharacterized protein n=3 Tax=Triticum TaxID=4564 RepID=A0A9R0S4J9_TRITD|nr:hypothetical protein CFC21_038562 [Triticum aestivum]VAH70131.1 unnamed protein product [Triticum turgidum subsp. durum]
MASSDAPDAAIAVAAPIPAPPRTDSHEPSGAKEAGSGGKQSHQATCLDGKNWRPGCHHRTYRTPAWESEKLYGRPLLQMDPNKFPGMFSASSTDAFMSYGAGAYQ